MNKTLKDLGKDYLKNALVKQEQIEKCKKKLRDATRKNNLDEIYRLRRLIKLFYCEKNDMIENGNKLVNYYI